MVNTNKFVLLLKILELEKQKIIIVKSHCNSRVIEEIKESKLVFIICLENRTGKWEVL